MATATTLNGNINNVELGRNNYYGATAPVVSMNGNNIESPQNYSNMSPRPINGLSTRKNRKTRAARRRDRKQRKQRRSTRRRNN